MQKQIESLLLGAISLAVLAVSLVLIVTQSQRIEGKSDSINNELSLSLEHKQDGIKLLNRTSFRIIKSEITDNKLNLLFKNTYDKSINAFYLTIGNNHTYNLELALSESVSEIPPGDIYTFRIPVEKELHTEGLTVRAVMFTNGTGDGEKNYIQEMKDVRYGRRLQLSQGLVLLQESLSESGANLSSSIENFKFKVSSIPNKIEGKSSAILEGMYFGKQQLERYVMELPDSNALSSLPDANDKALKLEAKLKEIIKKLQ